MLSNNEDNRDLNGLNIFCSSRLEMLDKMKKNSFRKNATWCDFRELQAELIYAAAHATSKQNVEEMELKLEQAAECIESHSQIACCQSSKKLIFIVFF